MNTEEKDKNPGFWGDREAIPEGELNLAVNCRCTCGGSGPDDPLACPACLVWHDLVTERDVDARVAEVPAMEIARLRSLIAAHVNASNNDDTAGDTFGALMREVTPQTTTTRSSESKYHE